MEFFDGGDGVAAAGQGEAFAGGDGVRNSLGTGVKRFEFEHAQRAVPDDSTGVADDGRKAAGSFGADVEDHFVGVDAADVTQAGVGFLVEAFGSEYVGGQRDGSALFLRPVSSSALAVSTKVGLVQGVADPVAGCGQKGVGDTAADDQLINLVDQRFEYLQLA